MKNTVNAFLEWYVKLGGALTDTYDDIANGAPVGSYTTIPDCIEACAKKATSGGGGGGDTGIDVYDYQSDLPATADNGSVAVVLNGGAYTSAVALPAQQEGESVSTEVGDLDIVITEPSYSADGLTAILTNKADETSFDLDKLNDGSGELMGVFIPVVDDVSDNVFVTAGMTIDADSAFVVSSCTKNYVLLFSTPYDSGIIKDSAIVEVDASHARLPIAAIYAYEDLSGTAFGSLTVDLKAGWNVWTAVCESDGHGGYGDEGTDYETVNEADLSDYYTIETSASSEINLKGYGASLIYAGVISQVISLGNCGLYVRLGNEWNRCTLDADSAT